MTESDRDHATARPGSDRALDSVQHIETALRESEARLRTVITGAPIVLFALDKHGVFTLSEGKGLEVLGLQPGDVVGQSVYEVYRDYPVVCDTARRAVAGESLHAVVEFAEMSWDLSYSALRDEHGEPAGTIGVATNVTERRRAERALAGSEAQHRALTENAAVGIWQVATDARTLYANPRMLSMLEIESPSDLLGRPIDDYFTKESLEIVRRERSMRFHGEPSTYQVRLRTARGKELDVEVSGAPVLDEDGALVSMIGVFLDITERKRAESKRRELELQVQQALRRESLGRLAGGIAHDFNNLQTAILGNASLVRQRLPPDSKEYLLLSHVEDAARRAAQLTSQMLAYAGKGRYEVVPLDLSAVVDEMRDLLDAAGLGRIQVAYELHEALPTIDADAAQMQQVLLSLVTNACESFETDAGDVVVRTGVSARGSGASSSSTDRFVILEVSDRGSGVDAGARERIFDPFYTTKAAGRGMGLAAVLGIVNGHRGTIDVEDRSGGGTTVRVGFPVSADDAPDPTPQPPEPSPASVAAPGGQPGAATILVVDDEDVVRDIVCLSLETVGHEVLRASSGEEALKVVASQGCDLDLVVLDLTMVGMSGAETLCAMRERLPDIPVLLISGYSRDDPSARYPRDGRRCAFLQKPFLPAELQAQVAAMLRNPD